MGLKTILVNLASVEQAETLMKVAIPLARTHGAHLLGLHVMETLMVHPNVAIHIPDGVHLEFNKSQLESARSVEKVFETQTKAKEFPTEWRVVKAETSSAASRILESARAADVVVTVQERRSWDAVDHLDDEIRVIRDSGRPVIVVPPNYEGPEIGNRILLGWSDTREATRAAHDALLVQTGQSKLDILRIKSPGDELDDHCTLDIAKAFDRHGMKVEVIQRARSDLSVAQMLEHEAAEKGADLIAVGAFGHSRLYDFAIGAVSHALLRNAKYPVLFSK